MDLAADCKSSPSQEARRPVDGIPLRKSCGQAGCSGVLSHTVLGGYSSHFARLIVEVMNGCGDRCTATEPSGDIHDDRAAALVARG